MSTLPSVDPVSPAYESLSAAALPLPLPRTSLWLRVAVGLALGVILAGYAVILWHWFTPAIQHPDANGYFAQATLLAQTGHTWFTPESSAQYIGMHWLLTDDGKYACRYPPGMALLIAPISTYCGWKAAVLVNPVLALLTMLGVFFVVRQLASGVWGLVAVLALVATPAFTEFALTDIAHMPVAFCLVWGIALLLWWSDRGSWWLALLAGMVLGCIPALRYPDAVIAGGVALFLLLHLRRFPRIGWQYAAAVAGALVPIVPLLVRNQLVFGAFWRTGYALTNEQTGFTWDYFCQHWQGYLQMLQGTGLGLWFGLGLVGMAWMIAVRRTRAVGLMLMTATVPFIVLYMAYYWAPGMGAFGGRGMMGGGPGGGGPGGGGAAVMRFLVPLVPVFVITAVWALAQSLTHAPRMAKVAVPVVVLGMQLLMYGPAAVAEMSRMRDQKDLLVRATDGLEQAAGHGSVVVANNGLLQHLDFVRHWKLADPSVIRGGSGPGGGPGGGPAGGGGRFGGTRRNDPNAPSPGQTAKSQARAQLYSGTTAERQQQFLADLADWADGREIYVIGSASDYQRVLPGVTAKDLTVVLRIKTPTPSKDESTTRERGSEAASQPAADFGPPGGPDPMRGPDLMGGPFGMGPPGFANARRGLAGFGGRGGGGPFGPGIVAGEDIVIARVKIPNLD